MEEDDFALFARAGDHSCLVRFVGSRWNLAFAGMTENSNALPLRHLCLFAAMLSPFVPALCLCVLGGD